MGEIPRQACFGASWGAEGETPKLGETLRQKDRNLLYPLERAHGWATEGESPRLSGQGLISQVKGQGGLGRFRNLPFFLM